MAAALSKNIDRENKSLLITFANSIYERNPETYYHSRRVATYAERLALYLGWSKADASDLALAALLHDLGKTWIGNDILLKENALTEEERTIMARHAVIGARILIGCEIDSFYVETVLHHHETWNGRGYPEGLHGEDIPLGARIVTVVDVYDILTSQHTFKISLPKDTVRKRLLLGSGTIFDPAIIEAFVLLIDKNSGFESPQPIDGQPVQYESHLPLHHSPFPKGI